MPLVGDTFKRTLSPTSNSRGLVLLSTSFLSPLGSPKVLTNLHTIVSVISWIRYGPNVNASCKSLQHNGVLHFVPYRASNRTILMVVDSYYCKKIPRKVNLLISLELKHISSQHIFKNLIHSFSLPICFRTIRAIKI